MLYKNFYGRLNVGDDSVIMYLFNSCYGDERLLEFFVNIFNKIGWKFFRVIFWFLRNKKNEIL